ncbi:PREDICTED: SKP1-like protein 11 [Nelumbo nucifera]|uniref:SKP1-like protein n=1 Tax=Nelumbo nucifera TaxID=4432 RepID=A0A1U7Z2B4_NELNU|nr:PREDICTED: SKP1-like protein 11 [Nelumbo nucifera]
MASSSSSLPSPSSSSSSSSSKKLVLRSSDEKHFEVDEAVALQSEMIKQMVEDGFGGDVIPLLNVSSNILSKVIDYCKKHVDFDSKKKMDDRRRWDAEYIDVGVDELYHLIMAANYRNIKGLLDLTCQKVADTIKGKKPKQIRIIFNIKNDVTPEGEQKIRKEHSWAFE